MPVRRSQVFTSEVLARIPQIIHGFGTRAERFPIAMEKQWNENRAQWKQVHGTASCEVLKSSQDCGECDALWSTKADIPIAVTTADCVPILLARKDGGAVAAIHSGWRGTKARILVELWKNLRKRGEKEKDWVAAIGPSIGPCCYEVSEELATDFKKEFGAKVVPTFRHIDLQLTNADMLRGLGISEVDVLGNCTRCTQVDGEYTFHSYRREGKGTGQWSALLRVLPLLLFAFSSSAAAPDWSEGARVPITGRPNPYSVPPTALPATIQTGKIHTIWYTVTITAPLVPYEPTKRFLDASDDDPLRRIFQFLFKRASHIRSLDDLQQWLGLHPYSDPNAQGVYAIPYPTANPDYRVGFTLMNRPGQGMGITFGCSDCHSANLFGKTVLGMANRFPNANSAFSRVKEAMGFVDAGLYRATSGATPGEVAMYDHTRKALDSVGSKDPLTKGLDTSLAQVALSLNRRKPDAWATIDPYYQKHPAWDPLIKTPADSKPAVWWNVKYKNRWLSDGSIVSGNPIYTNFIWNELGRGTDLRDLQDWLDQNPKVIEEITTAVFSSEAPRFTDFFPASSIDVVRSKQGEKTFKTYCSGCHGSYEKGWSLPGGDQIPLIDQLATTEVRYHETTPVVNVGTDPYRAAGMKSLERLLNPLAISQNTGTIVRAQNGYVPPPLVGIWARWPYFHNNSAPTLCAVLTAGNQRPPGYMAGEAVNPSTDFDRDCNGYPEEAKIPASWKNRGNFWYDTKRTGMSNRGHDEGIFLRGGKELLTPSEKKDLILFLQTL